MAARRVLFYVQHLLGIGHLRRAVALADGMTSAGLEVTLVTGGMPVPGLDMPVAHCVQLAPASAADLSFKTLLDEQGHPVDDAWRLRRRTQLMQAWATCEPDAVVVELFPFGRRQMRFELLPMLEAAIARVPRPLVVCSVRDVLGGGQSDPARADRTLEVFDRYFDQVLVHGDADLVPFGRTFVHADRLAGRLHYTGYVVAGGPGPVPSEPAVVVGAADASQREVLVSVGGGAVGRQLLLTALAARPLSSLHGHPWRLLAGINASDAVFEELQALAQRQSGVVVERYRADFAQRLGQCRLSISQAGYNTVMEILQARAPAVVVPFAGGAETEQTLRARLLAERGALQLLEEPDLEPQALARAIDRAAAAAHRPAAVRLDGAADAARWMLRRLQERSA